MAWIELGLFALAVAALALYGLAVSGHFPADLRAAQLRTSQSRVIIWMTIVVAGLAALVVVAAAWSVLPWYAIVIAGGAMLLVAPLLLQPFPDSFVDGRAALLVFSTGAAALAFALWMRAASA
jgi:hypothetical protein